MVTLDQRSVLTSIIPAGRGRPALQAVVKDPSPSPESHALAALQGSSYPGLRSVTCDMREGAAFLHGAVGSYYLKQLAQEIVGRIQGVEAVVNRLDVLPTDD